MTTNRAVLAQARDEIWKSWRATCAENKDHPRAAELFNPDKLPAFHDPFAGGGSLPLEAQRLGLESYASDLNPVAVLINKAMIEIPPKFAGRPPVNPEARKDKELFKKNWLGAQGLAEDVRYYGQWMRDEAKKRIGHLYPKVEVTAEMAKERPDLKPLVGRKLTVIAWLWARTVKSPNPAFAQVEVPLASTFMLSTKPGKESYVEPVIEDDGYRFRVRVGKPLDTAQTSRGTKSGGSHSPFLCLMSGTPMPFEYLRTEGKAGRLGARLMAVVAEGQRGRLYLPPTEEMEVIAQQGKPAWEPNGEISHWPGCTNSIVYGLTHFSHLFSARQLVALTTLSDLVQEARQLIERDALPSGLSNAATGSGQAGARLATGGVGATAYAEAVSIYLAFAVTRCTDFGNSLCGWSSSNQKVMHLFGKQALPMVWDFAEANILSDNVGGFTPAAEFIAKCIHTLPVTGVGRASQQDAATSISSKDKLVSTDPPYYDNVPYADLSDFFYVWLRTLLKSVFPDLFGTLAVPKLEELVSEDPRSRKQGEGPGILPRGHVESHAPPHRASAPGVSRDDLLCVQTI